MNKLFEITMMDRYSSIVPPSRSYVVAPDMVSAIKYAIEFNGPSRYVVDAHETYDRGVIIAPEALKDNG